MDPRSAEIALAITRTRAEILDPLYTELRDQFLGSVASQDLRSRQQELAHNRTNEKLLQDIVALLPSRHNSFYHHDTFELSDIATAKLVQAHVLVFSAYRTYLPDSYSGSRYVLGQKASDKQGVTELLLQPAGTPATKAPIIIEVLTEDLEARNQAASAILAQDGYTEEELNAIYNPIAGKVVLSNYRKSETTPFLCSTTVYRRQQQAGRVRMPKNEREVTTLDGGVTDVQLATFDVLKTISDLTTAFGVSEQTEQLLRNYVARDDTDGIII